MSAENAGPEPKRPEDTPPLHLQENAERLPLYAQLLAVLHNVRVLRLPEADAQEYEAIKSVAGTGTTELKTPMAVPESSRQTPRRDVDAEKRQRQQEKALQVIRRVGGRRHR